jgi:hypothetical protein
MSELDRLQVTRLPESLMRRLDAHVARLQRANPGVPITISAAVRNLLDEALGRHERREAARTST